MIKVIKYLTNNEKDIFTSVVSESYFLKNDDFNIIGFSEIEKFKSYVYCIMRFYANKEGIDEISDDEFVDQMLRGGLYDSVVAEIPESELYLLAKDIEAKIEYKKRQMDYDLSVAKALTDLLGKLPNQEEMVGMVSQLKDIQTRM